MKGSLPGPAGPKGTPPARPICPPRTLPPLGWWSAWCPVARRRLALVHAPWGCAGLDSNQPASSPRFCPRPLRASPLKPALHLGCVGLTPRVNFPQSPQKSSALRRNFRMLKLSLFASAAAPDGWPPSSFLTRPPLRKHARKLTGDHQRAFGVARSSYAKAAKFHRGTAGTALGA
jgi:hypothetical protein